jgi:hypothetical protein
VTGGLASRGVAAENPFWGAAGVFGSDAAESGIVGICTNCPQLGHFAFLPAAAESAIKTLPHWHLNLNFIAG